jgi:hypothetical protein
MKLRITFDYDIPSGNEQDFPNEGLVDKAEKLLDYLRSLVYGEIDLEQVELIE